MEDKKRKKEDKKKKDSAQKVGFDIWIILSSWNINSIGGNKMLTCLYLNFKKWTLLHHFPGTEVFYLDASSP